MEWLKSIYGLRCAASQMTDSNTGGALTTLTANPTESKDDRRGCAPVLSSRPQPKKEVQQVIAELEEILQRLEETRNDDIPDELVQKYRVAVIRARRLKLKGDESEGREQGQEAATATSTSLQEKFPRRWYDIVVPVDMDLDGRPTVKQVLAELESKGGLKAWQMERKKRRLEQASKRTGALVFWLVVLVLVLTPLFERTRLRGLLSSECSDDSEISECRWEILPYPRLALWCALTIVVLFKLCCLDMSRGPWGAIPPIFLPTFGRTASKDFVQKEGKHALPRVVTGAVPESEREGFYGSLEQFVAVWHGLLGSFAAAVLLLMSFSRHMSDSEALAVQSGEQLQSRTVVLAQAGALDDKNSDLSRCLAMERDDVLVVDQEFFGMRNLLLFMCGAVLFGIGELFKLRSVQDFPGKNLCGFDSLLRLCKPWIWSQKVRQLKAQANALAFQLQRPQSSGAGETDPLNETEASPDGHTVTVNRAKQEFGQSVCDTAEFLMRNAGWYNFGHLNFWRVVWAAVFQLAGVALWVPASLPELMPCLHQTSTWSVAKWMVTDAVDESEIISFGSVCALVAILCLVFALFLIPYELHVYSPFNPYNWPVKIKFLQGLYKACSEDLREGAIESQHWLRLIVDGVFLVILCIALLFGQMGAPWHLTADPTSGWDKEKWKLDIEEINLNPWALWRIQVALYAVELAMRFFGNSCVAGKSRVVPSVPEEAAYAAQVQDMLLEIVHQVADVAGDAYDPDPEIDAMLCEASNSLQLKVYDEYESALERRTFSEREYEDFERRTLAAGQGQRGTKPQEFIIDNRWLKAQTDGLSYRNSPDMEDHDVTRPVAPWYSLVYGYDLENGWVEVEGGGYLPAFVNDVPVLTIPEEEA
ncbi:unnamed protein product [Durusdinium trenchii]|uniref:Uncharacterized protein n=1 Tax=Durusdinium trenchii TaxID=1381693 RepID=A0ABP0ST51_9DINO